MSEKDLPSVPTDDSTFDMMLGGGGSQDFLPRITLNQPQSAPVANETGKQGEFMYMEKNLGKEFACHIGPWRPHALLTVDQSVVAESFDPANEWFKKIVSESTSGGKVEGRWPMFGMDFCIWVPGCGFGTYFLAKTARREAPEFKKLMGTTAAIYGFLVKTKKFSWWVPKIKSFDGEMDLPNADQIASASKMFMNPKSTLPELAPNTEGSDRAR